MADEAESFWNDPQIVESFANSKPREYWEKYFQEIKDRGSKKVLDLGCGGGRYSEMLAKLGFQVYACDYHSGMVESTQERTSKFDNVVEVIKADMKELPYDDNFFDIVLSNGVYHNAIEPQGTITAINETARILKKNGALALNIFYDGETSSRLNKVSDDLYKTKDDLMMVLFKKDKLLEIFKEAGFEVVGEVITYSREMDVGNRDVLRGIFVKK